MTIWGNPPKFKSDPPKKGKVIQPEDIAGASEGSQQIITRVEAIERGLKYYFTGIPCKHGHIVERLVSSYDCKVCHTRLSRNAGRKNALERTNTFRMRVYGLGNVDVDKMITNQNGKCLICKNEFKDKNAPHLDHNHKTGLVRGMLCTRCNTGLGLFKDDIQNLENAIAYLKVHDGLEKST